MLHTFDSNATDVVGALISELGHAHGGESTGSDGSRVTLRAFRERQRQELSWSIALAGEDRARAIKADLRGALAALEARDADKILRLVGRLVGFLEAPTTMRRKASIDQDELRDVILKLLGVVDERGLDTIDVGTRKLLKVPFKHVLFLLRTRSLDHLVSREQWVEIFRVASCSSAGYSANIKKPRRRIVAYGERARVTGIYEPNSRVKACGLVAHEASKPKVLKCAKCLHTITSSWYYVHPTIGKHAVLVPSTGHQSCRKPSAKAHFRPVDGSPYKADCINPCPHATEHKHCRLCNPSSFCSHGRRLWVCRVCRVPRDRK
mmetsp:Transcript_76290/g.246905  ORF Transcript_76290/g.246905 Transcript_76290/m.246905 type:complete len:321 (+) Transcript_76290:91-1053(+)